MKIFLSQKGLSGEDMLNPNDINENQEETECY